MSCLYCTAGNLLYLGILESNYKVFEHFSSLSPLPHARASSKGNHAHFRLTDELSAYANDRHFYMLVLILS
ncbi:MAG: hypothetical protein AVDCRST_MAG93-5807, partial [uncultured Chloroflexia bacterium]